MNSQRNQNALKLVRQWIEECVIDLGLCPFAGAPYRAGQVRLVVYDGTSEAGFLNLIEDELGKLLSGEAETTLVAGPDVLPDFLDFNEFMAPVEVLLEVDDRAQTVQMANFHPDYRFAGVDGDDAGNYTNRAPFPIIQWLRTDSVARAVSATDTLTIPDNNIKQLQSMSKQELQQRFPWLESDRLSADELSADK